MSRAVVLVEQRDTRVRKGWDEGMIDSPNSNVSNTFSLIRYSTTSNSIQTGIYHTHYYDIPHFIFLLFLESIYSIPKIHSYHFLWSSLRNLRPNLRLNMKTEDRTI